MARPKENSMTPVTNGYLEVCDRGLDSLVLARQCKGGFQEVGLYSVDVMTEYNHWKMYVIAESEEGATKQVIAALQLTKTACPVLSNAKRIPFIMRGWGDRRF